ncbi:hypothetical protein A5320_05045 [Rheinheimera sp. SA_1]|nr:hypothetical protein A5320_05045 [Rheinheimera sp. SA_1]
MRQWLMPLIFVITFLFLLWLPFLLLPKGLYWLLAAILLLPLIPILESLLLSPAYAVTGRFTYYSPLLFATKSTQGLDLHLGTLYDYLTHLRWSERGIRAERHAMRLMLQGLLNICDAVSEGRLSEETEITATSYFFSNSSVERLGFTPGDAPSGIKLNLAMVFLSLALRLSFIKGRWSVPNLARIRRVHTTAGQLFQHQSRIVKMLARLQRANGIADVDCTTRVSNASSRSSLL